MRKLRVKIKEKLILDDNINYSYIREVVESNRNNLEENINITLIFKLIHDYSNYEKVMWDFWKNSKSYCIRELTSVLNQISSLDRDLTWDCFDVLSYYENSYDQHHKKSLLVSPVGETNQFMNIELPELIFDSNDSHNNLVMEKNDFIKLKSLMNELKTLFSECKTI